MWTGEHRGRSGRARAILFGAFFGLALGLGPMVASGTPPSSGDRVASSSRERLESTLPSPPSPQACDPDHDAACAPTAAATSPAAQGPDVIVAKSADPAGSIGAGGTIAYAVTVTNAGDAEATGVRLHDDLPAGLSVLLSPFPSLAGELCTVASSVQPGGVPQASVHCGPVSLDAGASASVAIRVEANDGTCGTLTNVATVESTNEDAAAGANNTSNEVTNEVECEETSSPDLEITKTSDADGAVHEGDPITYTITVTNVGTTRARGVRLHDDLPRGVGVDTTPFPSLDGELCIVTSSIVSGGVAQATVDCGPISLDAGASASVTVTIPEGICGTNRNVARVEASNEPAELVGPENHADVTDEVDCRLHPDIALDTTASPTSGPAGTVIDYTYTVTNTGDTTLYYVSVTDDEVGPIQLFDPVSLAPGERMHLSATATLGASPVTNVATAVGEDITGQRVSAQDSATVTVVSAAGGEGAAGGGTPFTGADTDILALLVLALSTLGAILVAVTGRQRPAE